jgi:hypothetical protein
LNETWLVAQPQNQAGWEKWRAAPHQMANGHPHGRDDRIALVREWCLWSQWWQLKLEAIVVTQVCEMTTVMVSRLGCSLAPVVVAAAADAVVAVGAVVDAVESNNRHEGAVDARNSCRVDGRHI